MREPTLSDPQRVTRSRLHFPLRQSHHHHHEPTRRLDLDDLGGEICLLDWGQGPPTTSTKNARLQSVAVMNRRMTMTLAQESLQKVSRSD